MNEREMIEFWKANEKPFGLCPKECQEWLKNLDPDGLRYFSGMDFEGEYGKLSRAIGLAKVYRLPADYQPEKLGRWVECEVRVNGDHYRFSTPWGPGSNTCLVDAPGMVGFGGVFYPGHGWSRSLRHVSTSDSEKPTAPTKVRFWVEE